MDDKRKILYDAVSKEYNLGTYDEFNKKLDDPNKRKLLYDTIGKDYNLGTIQDFEGKINIQPQVKPTISVNAEPYKKVISDVGQDWNKTTDYFGKSNLDVPAGVGSSLNSIFNTAMTPLTMGATALRQVPGMNIPVNIAEFLMGAIPKTLSYSASGYLKGAKMLGLPISENAVNEWSNVAGNYGTLGLGAKFGKEIPKAAEFVKEKSATRNAVKGTEGLLKLAPPPKGKLQAKRAQQYRNEGVPNVARYIADDVRENGTPKGIPALEEVTNRVKDNIWNSVDVKNKPYGKAVINPSREVDAIINELPSELKKSNPQVIEEIRADLADFRQNFTMEEAQATITRLNAELKPTYDKNGAVVANMLKKKPVLDAERQFLDRYREKFFDVAQGYGDKTVEPLRVDYGAATNLAQELAGAREKNLAKDKQAIWSGSENPFRRGFYAGILGTLAGLTPAVAATIDAGVTGGGIISRYRNKPSALATRTMKQLSKSNLKAPTYEYVPVVPKGLLERGAIRLPQSLEGDPNMTAGTPVNKRK